MQSKNNLRFPHKLADMLEADDRANHDLGGDRLIGAIKDIGTAHAKIACLPLTHCDYIMSEFLNRMHDLFEAQCTANYITTGAEFNGTLKKDGIAYRITVEPIREE